MERNSKYRKIIGSYNWDRININEDFWNMPVEINEYMWEKFQRNHHRIYRTKEKE